MIREKKISLRMCLSCRKMKPKEEFFRIVKNKENNIVFDDTFKQEGRGSYVCKNEKCIELLKKSGRLEKQFKVSIPHDLYEQLEEILRGKND